MACLHGYNQLSPKPHGMHGLSDNTKMLRIVLGRGREKRR